MRSLVTPQCGHCADASAQLGGHSARKPSLETMSEFSIIPKLISWWRVEATPDAIPDAPMVSEDRSSVVQLVGQRNPQYRK